MKRFEGYHEVQTLPIKPGQTVTIRKGTTVKTVGKDPKPAGKTYKVCVHHILPGSSDTRLTQNEEPPYDFVRKAVPLTNPKVVWAGPGGYWSEADINDIPEAQEAP